MFAQPPDEPEIPQTSRSGAHDFDFEYGEWRVHHRVKRPGADGWVEFDGTCRDRGLIDGSANVEEHTFRRSTGVSFGIAIRAYDPKSAEWAIWWIDGRAPHSAMDPPVKGRFDKGVGTFYSDSIVDGKTIRTRYLWSHITICKVPANDAGPVTFTTEGILLESIAILKASEGVVGWIRGMQGQPAQGERCFRTRSDRSRIDERRFPPLLKSSVPCAAERTPNSTVP